MARHFNWGGTEYYETEFKDHIHYKHACKLANDFFWTGNPDHKFNKQDIEEYLSCTGENEIWFLCHSQKRLLPLEPFFQKKIKDKIVEGISIPPRFYAGLQKQTIFNAVAFMSPYLDEQKDFLTINCDLIAREPFADVAAVAHWIDTRFRQMNEELAGANENKLIVTERDLPLQRELKRLGYFAFEQDRATGDLYFSKILRIRSRETAKSPKKR